MMSLPLPDNAQLPDRDECKDVIGQINLHLAMKCSPVAANEIAEVFVKSFPKRSVMDAKTYIRQWVIVLASYPFEVSKTVTHPMEGLLAQSKFLPTIAELKEYLDGCLGKHVGRSAKAHGVLEAYKVRDEQERWQQEREKTTPEERKSITARALQWMETAINKIPSEPKKWDRQTDINKTTAEARKAGA